MGWYFANGRGGLATDKQEAARWYRRAAEQGEGNAQKALEELR
jgi:TPR repeat protein